MKLTHSYKVKIINVNDCLTDTILIYRKALAFIIDVVEKEWSKFDGLKSKSQINLCESLIHETKDNPNPLYGEFDKLFYKYPSYLRRSTIQDAVGIVSSFRSNLINWENEKYKAMSNGKKFKKQKPKLRLKHFKCPTLYKGNMYLNLMDGNKACIKIYKLNKRSGKGDWVWFNINLREQDLKYIRFNTYKMKEQSPTLVKNGKKYYLQFPFEQIVTLNKIKLKDTKVCAVDLGVNHSAVCSIIDYNGVTLIGLYGEDMYEEANGYMAIEDMFEGELIKDCGEEFDLKLRLNNDCCSFNYAKLIFGDNTYLLPIHSFVNNNYTNDVYLNFNELVLEEEILNNFPRGRRLGYYYNTTMLKHMVDIKKSLGNDESLNYYIRNRCNVKGEGKEFNLSDIPDYLGHSILDCEGYVEIKDYDNTKFVIKKISGNKIDFDTIKIVG